jgi:hypothetical protein
MVMGRWTKPADFGEARLWSPSQHKHNFDIADGNEIGYFCSGLKARQFNHISNLENPHANHD